MSQHTDQMAAALRMLADDIENERVPAPFDIQANVFWLPNDEGHLGDRVEVKDARLSMDLTPGGWSKNMTDAYAGYVKNYGNRVTLEINVERQRVCRRVQVGTEHVEATEAHDRPVYEWVCDEDPTLDEA